MRQGDPDQMVSAAICRALRLTESEEDGMWTRFLARRAAEREAWRAFAGVMMLVTVAVRQATGRRAWGPLLIAVRHARL